MSQSPYEKPAHVTLTLADWTTVLCALSDSVRWCREQGYTYRADESLELRERVRNMLERRLASALKRSTEHVTRADSPAWRQD